MPEFQGDTNQNKPQEIPNSGPEQKLENPLTPKIPKKTGFRKQIARRLVGAAIALSAMGVPGDNSIQNPNFSSVNHNNPEATQSLSAQDLEKKAEQLFQIQIASPQEGTVTLADGTEVKPNEWTTDELADLMKALDKLPPHFYLPGPKDVAVSLPSLSRAHGYGIDPSKDIQQQKKEAQVWRQQIKQQNDEEDIATIREVLGKDFKVSEKDLDEARKKGHFQKQVEGALPVTFIIPDVIPLNLRPGGENLNFYIGECYCGTSPANPTVLLSYRVFRGDFDGAFGTIVHELTHRVSKQEDYKFVSELLGVPENMNFGDFVFENAQSSSLKSISALEDAGFPAWTMNKYYYGTRKANEYISVASEFYTDGKEKFLKMYSIFIGKEKAQELYDYMRNNIFRGKEYQGQR